MSLLLTIVGTKRREAAMQAAREKWEKSKIGKLALQISTAAQADHDVSYRASTKGPCTGPGDWTASGCRATGCRSRGSRLPFPSAGMTP